MPGRSAAMTPAVTLAAATGTGRLMIFPSKKRLNDDCGPPHRGSRTCGRGLGDRKSLAACLPIDRPQLHAAAPMKQRQKRGTSEPKVFMTDPYRSDGDWPDAKIGPTGRRRPRKPGAAALRDR